MPEEQQPTDMQDEQELVEQEARRKGERIATSYTQYAEEAEGRFVGLQEREDMIRGHIGSAVSHYHHERADKELEEYFISWDTITEEDVLRLREAIEGATKEEDMQRFLTENKIFLVQHLGGGHGRYVLPKPKLGNQWVPDFLVAGMSSIGLEWCGVELESPCARVSIASGQPSRELRRAQQQIHDWREWLTNNIAYARTPKAQQGLGLAGVDGNLPATILIGRRQQGRESPANSNGYRREMKQRMNIEIHTYDWLVEVSEARVESLRQSR